MIVSWLDEEPVCSYVKQLILAGETNASIARMVAERHDFPTTESSIRRFRVRHELNPEAFKAGETFIDGDEGYIDTGPTTEGILQDPDVMIRQRGLDPEEWRIADGMRVNQYEGPASADSPDSKITYYQTRFNIERIKPENQVLPARTDGWKAPFKASVPSDKVKLVVIVGDQQAPFQDPGLHTAFLSWLEFNRPHKGVSLGDSVDFADIRPGHRYYPEMNATVNIGLQSGYDMFRGYVNASPDTWWQKLMGNHDERIYNIFLDSPKMRPIHGLKRPDAPDSPGERVHALSHLMRLDELDIEVVETGGHYEHGQINLSKYLAVRHGWLARSGSGSTALATLETLRYSVVVGHTHRQSIVYKTTGNIDGEVNTLTAAEAGCMCRIDQVPDDQDRIWPGYTVSPDWQQGFMTATIWPDGKFHLDPAIYVDGVLLYRDQRYEVNA